MTGSAQRANWDQREQVLLEAIADAEASGDPDQQLNNDDLEAATGIERAALQRGLLALLEAGYITGIDAAAEEECYLIGIRLQERGYRAVRMWPSEDVAQDWLAVIEQRVAETDDPEEQTRLQKLLDGAKGVGTATLQQMLVATLRQCERHLTLVP